MSILDSLVNVSISISSPVAQVASFSTMLIVADAEPSVIPSGVVVPPVGIYTNLSEVSAMGWESTEPTYKTAATAFGNGATELFIAVPQTDSGTSQKETLDKTLARALETDGWYGFVLAGSTYSDVSGNYQTAQVFADASKKLFGFVADWNGSSPTSPVTDSPYCYGFATKYTGTGDLDALNLDIACAIMAKAFTYDAGAETWAYKSLSGIKADAFTVSEISAIKAAGLNYYIECAGRNITLDGKTTFGEWIDVIRFKDWLINDIQYRIYSALVTNPKIPYTDDGINVIFGKITASLTTGQNRGGIAEADYDELGHKIPGFTVTVPNMASIPESQRATRVLSGVKFTARLAGAIHIVSITGTLTQ